MKILGYVLSFCFLISITYGYRILAIFPFSARSHQLFDNGIARTLANAGHEVTMVSALSFWKNPPKNYHYIKVNTTLLNTGVNYFDLNSKNMIFFMQVVWQYGYEMCENTLAEPGFQELMKAKGKYDVVIVEAFFNECFMGFAHALDLPLIQVVSYIGSSWITDSVGAPTPYSYVYEPYMNVEPHMPFTDRLKNTLFGVGVKLARSWIYLPTLDHFMRKYFQDPNMPSISEIETTRTSLLLINNHESFSYAKPGMPNMVNVAGMHIQAGEPLPSHLQKFMDEAKHGVIFFSMGSNIRMKEMDSEKLAAFIRILSKAKQNILWRWDDDFPYPKEYKNIIFSPWFPQLSILSHPNLILFATHGGLLSTIEAVDKGVPVIGFPIFADQILNMRRFQAKGLGIVLEYTNITESSLNWGFTEILKPKYSENAKKYSRLFHDRERTPQESTVWWVEYIIRNKGARHLRSPALDQAWYQYYLLDIIAVLFIALYIPYRAVKCVSKLIFSKDKPLEKIKKQ